MDALVVLVLLVLGEVCREGIIFVSFNYIVVVSVLVMVLVAGIFFEHLALHVLLFFHILALIIQSFVIILAITHVAFLLETIVVFVAIILVIITIIISHIITLIPSDDGPT